MSNVIVSWDEFEASLMSKPGFKEALAAVEREELQPVILNPRRSGFIKPRVGPTGAVPPGKSVKSRSAWYSAADEISAVQR